MLVITTVPNTKEKILKAALKLFSQKGYLRTTTHEVFLFFASYREELKKVRKDLDSNLASLVY